MGDELITASHLAHATVYSAFYQKTLCSYLLYYGCRYVTMTAFSRIQNDPRVVHPPMKVHTCLCFLNRWTATTKNGLHLQKENAQWLD